MLIGRRTVLDTWNNSNGGEQVAIEVRASRVAYLVHDIEPITMGQSTAQARPWPTTKTSAPGHTPAPTADDSDDKIP